MKIWIIKNLSFLPSDGDALRLSRMGLLAKTLLKQGHTVDWVTFHLSSIVDPNRDSRHYVLSVQEGWMMHVLPSVRPSGFFRCVMWMFHLYKYLSSQTQIPDVIVCEEALVSLCFVVRCFARHRDIPVVVDVHGLANLECPQGLSKGVKPFYKAFLWLRRYVQFRQFRHVTSVVCETSYLLKSVMSFSKRPFSEYDKVFFDSPLPQFGRREDSSQVLREYGLTAKDWVLLYVGSLDRELISLDKVLLEFFLVAHQAPHIKLVIVGDGPDELYYKSLSSACSQVMFFKPSTEADLSALYHVSTFGLIPTLTTQDSQLVLPVEAKHCLFFGLPMLTSLQGALYELLYANNCGTYYRADQDDSFYQCLSLYLEYPELIQTQRENVKHVYQTSFVAESVYNSYGEHVIHVAKRFSHPDRVLKR